MTFFATRPKWTFSAPERYGYGPPSGDGGDVYDPTSDAYRERVNEIEAERHLEAEDREHRRREEAR